MIKLNLEALSSYIIFNFVQIYTHMPLTQAQKSAAAKQFQQIARAKKAKQIADAKVKKAQKIALAKQAQQLAQAKKAQLIATAKAKQEAYKAKKIATARQIIDKKNAEIKRVEDLNIAEIKKVNGKMYISITDCKCHESGCQDAGITSYMLYNVMEEDGAIYHVKRFMKSYPARHNGCTLSGGVHHVDQHEAELSEYTERNLLHIKKPAGTHYKLISKTLVKAAPFNPLTQSIKDLKAEMKTMTARLDELIEEQKLGTANGEQLTITNQDLQLEISVIQLNLMKLVGLIV